MRMRSALLDLIRVLAMSLVLLAHIAQSMRSPLGAFWGIKEFYYVTLGGMGVTVFVIVSGVVLQLKYGQTNLSYARFMINRCFRIYPVYYLSLLFGIIIYFIKSYCHGTKIILPDFTDLLLHLAGCITGGYAFFGQWSGPFVGTSWFIGLIMTMYLTYPFVSKWIKHSPHSTVISLLLVSIFSRIILGKYEGFSVRPLDWFPLCRIFEFGLGIYIATAVGSDIWVCINKYRRMASALTLLSNLSFPLFLIHYPLLIIIQYLVKRGFHETIAIGLFLGLTTSISFLILRMTDNSQVQRTGCSESNSSIKTPSQFDKSFDRLQGVTKNLKASHFLSSLFSFR